MVLDVVLESVLSECCLNRDRPAYIRELLRERGARTVAPDPRNQLRVDSVEGEGNGGAHNSDVEIMYTVKILVSEALGCCSNNGRAFNLFVFWDGKSD